MHVKLCSGVDMFTDIYRAITNFLYRLVISFVDMLKDLFFWIFETVTDVLLSIISSVFALFSPIEIPTSFIPPNVSWVFSQIGLPNCLLIIVTALIVRMMLQLIPFVRLGS